MRLVKVFEGGGDAYLRLRYDLRFGQVALCLFRFGIRHINLSETRANLPNGTAPLLRPPFTGFPSCRLPSSPRRESCGGKSGSPACRES